jgi:dTDP-4-amino-4,6-dideoxygalactose transaminase
MRSIPFNIPNVTGREQAHIDEVFRGGHFAGNGPFTKRAQRMLEERFGFPHVLLTTSCTAALELSALLLDLGPDAEVIVPSFTFVSTASAYLRNGARVVFAEVSPDDLTMDVDDALARVTSRTRAIVPIHYAGIAADVVRLRAECDARGLVLIEDAAQGLDASLDHTPLGRFGRVSAFSFHETKNIHCGLGGALALNDPSLFERAENIWERGTNRQKMFRGLVDKYSWVDTGSSFYPAELQAAFLVGQLEELDANTAARRALAARYQERLAAIAADLGRFRLPRRDRNVGNGHAVFAIFESFETCEHVRKFLKENGVMAFIGYVPLHSSTMGQRLGWRPEDLPVTEELAPRILRFPMYAGLTMDDVDHVCDLLAWALER